MAKINHVIVVGAGPTGLLLSLLLAQHGISVQILESQSGVDQRPRGLAYGPSAIRYGCHAIANSVTFGGLTYCEGHYGGRELLTR